MFNRKIIFGFIAFTILIFLFLFPFVHISKGDGEDCCSVSDCPGGGYPLCDPPGSNYCSGSTVKNLKVCWTYACYSANCADDNIGVCFSSDTTYEVAHSDTCACGCSSGSCISPANACNVPSTCGTCNTQYCANGSPCAAGHTYCVYNNNGCSNYCSSCVEEVNNCASQCTVTAKYKCSGTSCVRDDTNGTYTSSNCNGDCNPSCSYSAWGSWYNTSCCASGNPGKMGEKRDRTVISGTGCTATSETRCTKTDSGCNTTTCGGSGQKPCCNSITLNVSPNTANIGSSMAFTISGMASTHFGDDKPGVNSCTGSWSGPNNNYYSGTCTAQTAGNHTWTHTWRNCVGGFSLTNNDCSDLCSATATYIINNPISSWIKASGDVHANDGIHASGGPDAIAGVVCPGQSTTPRVLNGLISTYGLSDNFGNQERLCVVGNSASFAPYKIPTYEDLKSLYYTQSKATKTDYTPPLGNEANQGTINSNINIYSLLNIKGNLRINGTITANPLKPFVVFVDNELNINGNITYGDGDANSGLVFVVGGNVLIDKTVTRIDAVIISQGIIYTATDASATPPSTTCTTNSATVPSALTINGSLISLDSAKPIKFCRTLADNRQPAELINNQPKYLVILRDLLSTTYQKWKEIE